MNPIIFLYSHILGDFQQWLELEGIISYHNNKLRLIGHIYKVEHNTIDQILF